MGDSAPGGRGRRWTWAGGLLLAALLATLLSPLWTGRALPRWDALDFYYPAFTYLSDSLREGRFPLWDPFTNGGEPFHADPQKMVLNPVALAVALLVEDSFIGFVLVWFVHWLWGAAGMMWLARRSGGTPAGALVAGGSYAFSGFFVSHAEHIPYLVIAAWLPWILGLAEEAVARRRASSALLAALAMACCAAGGGYPMLVAFTGLAVALWLALRFVLLPPPEEAGARGASGRWALGTLALMAVVLVVAWAPLLHAFLAEASELTARMSSTTAEAAIYGEPFTARAAISLFFPYATIFLPLNGVPMFADISMTNAYVGFAAVPLAATWVVTGLRERRSRWLLAFTAFMLLVSLGGAGGVRILLHYLFPPLQYMRFNAPFRLFWIFALCLAAGLGTGLVGESAGARRLFWRLALGWLAAGVAVAAVLFAWLGRLGLDAGPALPPLLLPAAVVAPVVVGLALWHRRGVAASGRLQLLLALAVCADGAAHLYVNDFTVWTWDDGSLARIAAARRGPSGLPGAPPARRPVGPGSFNWQLIAKVPLLGGYTALRHPEYNDVLSRSRFAELLCGPLRFWVVPGTEPMPSRPRALAELAQTGGGGPVPAFDERAEGAAAPRVVPGSFGAARVDAYAPEEIALTVQVPGPSGGLLASTERYTRGWKVWVDGRPAEPVRLDLFFRGVELAPGIHQVLWRYQPPRWWGLVALSSAALVLVAIAAAALRIRERAGGAPAPG